MAQLPFATYIQIPSDLLSGPVELTLTPRPHSADDPATEEDYRGAISLLRLFVLAIDAQAFSSDAARPAHCTVHALQWDDARRVCVLRAQVQHVPPHAWAHLLAMVQKNHDALEELDAVSIVATVAAAASIHDAGALFDAAAQATAAQPEFDWDDSGTEKFRNLRLELSFADALDDQHVQAIEQDLGVWLQMNILGAFDLGLEDADDLDPLGMVQQESPYAMTCSIPYFNGHTCGFVALQNMVVHFHRDFQALEVAALE